MTLTKRFGLLALLSGALAVPAAAVAIYLRASHTPDNGTILQWMDALGLARSRANAADTMAETSIFFISDDTGVSLLFALAIMLAVAAMGLALVAEFRREPTLFLSGGYVCGVLAVALIKPAAGFVLFTMGIMAAMVIRHGRRT